MSSFLLSSSRPSNFSYLVDKSVVSRMRKNENCLVGRRKPINRFHYALHGGQMSDEMVDSVDVPPRLTRIELTLKYNARVSRTPFSTVLYKW